MGIFNFFKEVRSKDLGKFDFNERTKVLSNGFDLETLEDIKSDLSCYIKKEALIDIKEGKTFNITGPLSSIKKTQAFKIDYSILKNPKEFKRLEKYQQYLLDKIYELKEARKNHHQLPIIEENQSKSPLLNGKKLNLSERYKIACEICNIYETINKKNISSTQKHLLLAFIMGCSQQVARELFNGTQVKRTPIRDEIINPYLESLK